MGKKHKHEDHVNHEAWAIPYGDLITLLLAFFVVMYSVSSVNEGKYRTMSASLAAAFRGIPTTTKPLQIGEAAARSVGSASNIDLMQTSTPAANGETPSLPEDLVGDETSLVEMRAIAVGIEKAMGGLVEDQKVIIRSNPFAVEVEIQTDILFPSGVAQMTDDAVEIMTSLADVLTTFKNPIRVEGHTDSVPINTTRYPSNWELSAARAAGVVHLLTRQGVEPERLSVVGFAEYEPAESNDTPEGRNRNRRVLLTIPSKKLSLLQQQLKSLGRSWEEGESPPDQAMKAE